MRRSIKLFVAAALGLLLFVSVVPAEAQRRRPGPAVRPGGARLVVGAHFGSYYGPYAYNPWFYGSFWYHPFGYPYYYWGRDTASIRVQVEPKHAQVFVDGAFAGTVDDYDGFFQSLPVEPGSRDITIYLEGHRSIVERMYLSPGRSYRIKGALERLAAGEPDELRPQPLRGGPAGQPRMRRADPREVPQPGTWPGSRPPQEAYPPAESRVQAPAESGAEPPLPQDARFGQLAIRVQPAGAEVTIDGEVWHAPEGAERLVVHLQAGTHRVEIRKDGFDPFVTSIVVRRGEVASLNVSLAKL